MPKQTIDNLKERVQADLDKGMFYKICSNETTFKEYVLPLIDQAIQLERERLVGRITKLTDGYARTDGFRIGFKVCKEKIINIVAEATTIIPQVKPGEKNK